MMDILLRALIAAGIAAAAVGAYAVFSRWTLRRAKGKLAGLEHSRLGVPTILYFTTPSCVPCRTVQGPAIESLQAAYERALQVIKIDAEARPDLADYWGVLSVPTTFVFDTAGRPRFMNPGVASGEKLERQLFDAGLTPAARSASAAKTVGEGLGKGQEDIDEHCARAY